MIRSNRKRVFFAFIATIAFLVLIEVVLRISGAGMTETEKVITDIYDIEFEYKPDTRNPWSPIEETINSQGFRGRQLSVEKEKGTYRIITVGDSCTFGVEVLVEQTFTYLLEQALKKHYPEKKIEVMNAGIVGTNIYQHGLLLKRRLMKFAPDLLIFYSAYRSGYMLQVPKKNQTAPLVRKKTGEEIEPKKTSSVQKVLRKSALYRTIRKQIKGGSEMAPLIQISPKSLGFIKSESPEWIQETLQKDVEAILQTVGQKIELIFVGQISREGVKSMIAQKKGLDDADPHVNYDWDGRRVIEKLGLRYVDLFPSYETYKNSDDLFLDEIHPSIAGHQMIAQAIFDRIITWNLID